MAVGDSRRSIRAGGVIAALASAILLAAGCGDGDGSPAERPAPDADGDVELAEDRCDDATLRPRANNVDRIPAATLCLTNAEREERGLEPLDDDEDLAEAARRKAVHMVENRYFAHVGPEYRNVRDCVRDTDYLDGARGFRLGENLGWASEGAATPATVVEGWMRSRGHRENILREGFEDSGIGVALGAPRKEGGGGATYVQVFGRT